jgi:hypothetical protein
VTCAGVVSGGNIAHSRVNSAGVVRNRRLDHTKAAFAPRTPQVARHLPGSGTQLGPVS